MTIIIMIDKWYNYNQFRFSKDQIKWALANIQTLRDGQWPPSHKESGYVGEVHVKRVSHEGRFVKAASIASELDWRIQRCNLDGLLLEFLYAGDYADENFMIEHLAQCLNLERNEVQQRIKNALRYVSGSGRKKNSYKEYIRKHQDYLKEKRTPFSGVLTNPTH